MKKKQLPFGLYNTLLCLMAAIIFVLGVMCVQAAEEKWYLKIDLSDDGVSRLSDYTRSRLEALEEDVTLHIIHSYGIASDLYDLQSETLMKMAAECPRITVETIDPAAQPHLLLELAGDTAGIPEGTVFVRNQQGSRTVRIDAEEFIFARRIGADQYTIYCGEAMLIGGIDRAVDEDPAAVWFITGHGEAEEAATAQLRLQLSAMGLEVRSGVLAMIQPQPGDVLALIAPETDLTDGEAAALKNHLNSGIHLLAACGADTPIDRLPNLTALMDLYGLGWRSGWAVESPAQTAYFVDEPALLSPILAEGNGVLDALPGRLILPRSCALATPALRPGTTSKVLLTTSDEAILKKDVNAATAAAQPGDESGCLPLAILAECGESSILQLSSAQMLLTGVEGAGSHVLDASENLSFVAACMEHITDSGEGATLEAGVKQLPTQLITFPNQQVQQQVSLVLLLALPTALTLIMLIVVLRRRRL